MKNILSILVAVIGLVCVVFGVMFIMQAGDNKATVVDELKSSGLTTATLNATYDQVKGALEQATAAKSTESMQSYGYQKASLGLAKSNLNTIDFVQKSGILTIIIGAALVWLGWGLMKKS